MITDGLVLDYRGTAKDWSRYHHTITNNNAVPVRGIKGDAFFFNGTNAYLDCGNDSSLNITDAITIEAWVKYNKHITGDIVYKSGEYLLRVETYGDYERFNFFVWDGSSWEPRVSTPITNENTWYHVVGVWDRSLPSNELKIYLNGVLKGQTDRDFSPIPTSNDVLIGSLGGISEFFNGTIDEVRIYNRALPAYEITDHYYEYASYLGVG